MSRDLGGRFVTSLPSIRMRPLSTSSSPASMRRLVDLPQPEGPTRTRNSPSAMSRFSASPAGREAPGYRRVAWSNVIGAMALLGEGRVVQPCDGSHRGAVTAEDELGHRSAVVWVER